MLRNMIKTTFQSFMKYCNLLKLLRCVQVNLYGSEKIGACIAYIQKRRLCIQGTSWKFKEI